MPIFEFMCTECNEPFEELVRSANAVDDVDCPSCGSTHVNKMISTFASKISGTGTSSFSSSASSCAPSGT
jgi:putative FmdB family regulatory protein